MRKLPFQDEILPAGDPSPAGRPVDRPGDSTGRALPSAPALRFDWTDWLPYLEDQDIPEEQKRELIETLWSIVVAFVDLGWQLNPKPEFSGGALDLRAILTAVETGEEKEAE